MKIKLQEEFLSRLEEEIIEIKKKITSYKEQFEICIENIGKMTDVSFLLDTIRDLKETLVIKEFELSIHKKYFKDADTYINRLKLENKRSIQNYKNNL